MYPNGYDSIETFMLRELRDAIAGTDADYTKIPLRKAIVLLAVPMVLELVMESTFALVDIFFVGKLGSTAVATVGLTESFLFVVYAVGMGLAMSVTAIIARRIGEKHTSEAATTAVQAIIASIVISVPIAVVGLVYAPELLALMGADANVLATGPAFTRWMLGGNVVIMLLFVINAIFRGAGDASIAMKVLWLANGINLVLDPLLIFGWGPIPAFGVEGAGMATTIGRGCGVAFQFWVLFNGSKHLRLTRENLVLNVKAMVAILRTSIGGIGQMLVGMTAWIFLLRILASVGTDAVSASTITIRIMMFCLMPAWGMSNAAATLVGQNLGAGSPERAESAVWKTGMYNMVYLAVVSVVFFLFPEPLIGQFTTDPRVVSIGAEWLTILSYSFIVYGWWMVAVQAFNGAGDTRTPTFINIAFFWCLQIPLGYVLAIKYSMAHSGVFWAAFISETSVGLFTLWLFSRGGWKKVVV
ncbi:MAG TPA: MATE family efflux transporter [Candidatus Didemnitutus sp.]|nr:MATE family efflux transporter [Candidatus Didemnitutus sp.]